MLDGYMQVTVAGPADRARFNAAVASSPRSDVMQSYEWGEIKARTGWDALRLMVIDNDGSVRATCSILRITPIKGVPPLLYAPRGPVWDYDDDEALTALMDAIRARAGKAFLFKCDPPVERDSAAAKALARAGMRSVAGGAFGGVQPVAIMMLDLSPGAAKVFEGFKSKWRYNVRLAEKKGVAVREGTREDIGAFHALYAQTALRDGFTSRARTYFETLWDTLIPAGALKMFVAEYSGRAVAAILCTMMGERVIYNYGASSNEDRNVMPNHLIQWHAIQWAAEAGYRIYDFRGVSPMREGEATASHIAGLNRFKQGFGGQYVEYAGEFDAPLRAGWYAAWRYGAPSAMTLRARIRGAAPAPAEQ